jgi:hypothetical protein
MPENILKSKGRTSGYKFDRGGAPMETGPFVGEVMNNVDPTRNGRVQVYIEEFGKQNKNDASGWRTVSYLTPFYGKTEPNTPNEGVGRSIGNSHSYGMWFTSPDLGTKVLCFFVNGDPNYGYYAGCITDPGQIHMIPATGDNVTEINNRDPAISENPRFYDQEKPQHSSVVATMYQQGLTNDDIRGPIGSTVQRESPSNCYGISTPGRPVYANGLYDSNIKATLDADTNNEITQADVKVVGRRGGHSITMDDGDLEGKDQLLRIRTALGHQITMSDDGECFYITHANGQSWLEFGKSGTIDLYSSNSVNVRTQGTINLHADEDININAGKNFNVYTGENINIESVQKTNLLSKTGTDVKSVGNVNLESTADVAIGGARIDLNKGGASTVTTSITPMVLTEFTDSELKDAGWVPEEIPTLKSITTRAPTHEPYSLHNEPAPGLIPVIDREELDEQIIALINNAKVQPPRYT